MTTFITTHAELSLGDMPADPIVQTMMARDRVKYEDVEGLFAALRKSAVDQTRKPRPENSSRSIYG